LNDEQPSQQPPTRHIYGAGSSNETEFAEPPLPMIPIFTNDLNVLNNQFMQTVIDSVGILMDDEVEQIYLSMYQSLVGEGSSSFRQRNFSDSNKIGEGGFGSVYKGVLEDGKEIVVKRLSEISQQGLDEFKNEHGNLVKLFGCCVQQNEMILIYEYMTNTSLDWFLFGVLYLHQDSRLQIIHRDLKASNILLDGDRIQKYQISVLLESLLDMIPLLRQRKWSKHNEIKPKTLNTNLAYIPPEYAVHRRFSIISGVFSFGVLVLEIICGMKNREFFQGDHSDNLLGHAWGLFKKSILSIGVDQDKVNKLWVKYDKLQRWRD
ncbi:hypothetical protein M8C21_022652, partial [Ambrosia artemisiifolia]